GLGSDILLHSSLELLSRTECYNTTCLDRDFLTGFRVTAGSLFFITKIKIAKTGELDLLVVLQCQADFLKELFNQLLGFTFVDTELIKKTFGHFSFCQRAFSHLHAQFLNFALNLTSRPLTHRSIMAFISSSSRVREGCCQVKPKAILFLPEPMASP